jgi:hypothetical protein
MPRAESGRGEAHRFVWEAGGRERFLSLLGRYLPTPRWLVRVATFEGDVAARAEEWVVLVNHRGEAERTGHQLPEARPGASLPEADARSLAVGAVQEALRLPPSALREVSVQPSKLAARTDWLFTFEDRTVPPIVMGASQQPPASDGGTDAGERGEARIEVEIAGAEVTRVRPFIRVPEEWQRAQRGRETLLQIAGIFGGVIAASALAAGAVLGILAWSRRQFAPRIFAAVFGVFMAVSLVDTLNDWPSIMASLSTAQPFAIQVLMVAGSRFLAILLPAAMLALAAGMVPSRMPLRRNASTPTAVALGVAAGLVAVAAAAAVGAAGEPPWPNVSLLGSYSPILKAATGNVARFMLRTVTLIVLLSAIDRLTHGWTTRRVWAAILLIVTGAALGGAPAPHTMVEWLVTAAVSGFTLLAAYVWLLRFDLSLTPIALATLVGAAYLHDGILGAGGGLPGSAAGIAVTTLTAWWLFSTLRRARVLERG